MKKPLKLWLIVILIISSVILVLQLITNNYQLITAEQQPPAMTPEAQTSRLTSYLLIKKIEELRERAVYLQHREEGRWLVGGTSSGFTQTLLPSQ